MAGVFSSQQNYLGTGKGSKQWMEAFIHGVVSGSTTAGNGQIYGGLGAIAQGTWGDGDPAGYTTGRERDADLENAYLGWRSSDKLFDLSVGRQGFQLGDGFLISGDRINLGKGLDKSLGVKVNRGGAYYIAAKKSFHNTAILRVDPAGPLRGDLFWLSSNNPYQQDTKLGGVNVEYVADNVGTVGASWMKVLDVAQNKGLGVFNQRDGMRITSLRGQGSMGVENLFLSAEYVDQRGGSTAVKNSANAWYLEGGWTFSDLAWKPTLNYRHARFSGDNASTTRNEAFDPLFFGLSRGLGTWYQGEVAANYAGPANSGNKVNRLELTVTPREDLSITLQAWKFSPLNDARDTRGREVDLFAFWQLNKNLTLVPLIGLYDPQGADVKAAQGNSDRNVYMEMVLMFNY